MIARFRSWWKNTSKTLKIVQIIVLLVVVVLLIGGYFFNWTWTGFGPYTPPTSNFQREKTLYDWLQLAIIPVVLVVGGFLLNNATGKTEREIALDKQRDDALKAYIDSTSTLLLEKDLRKSGEDAEVRNVARVRTLTVLPRLDKNRKATVLLFLHESGLIITGKSIVDLRDADLSGAFLRQANLYATGLRRTNLKGAYLNGACMNNTFLEGADLDQATLYEADLSDAHLK